MIEILSDSHKALPLQQKMAEYLTQGARLGWLIDPEDRSVEIYRAGAAVEKRTGINTLEGEGPVTGFVLDLIAVCDPLGA